MLFVRSAWVCSESPITSCLPQESPSERFRSGSGPTLTVCASGDTLTQRPERSRPHSGNRSIARSAGQLISARVLASALQVTYLIALARILGPQLFGLLTYAMFWQLMFLALVMFGIGRRLCREIGRDELTRVALVNA